LPVHEKKESQEICFIIEKDYREFLRKNIPEDYFKPGDIVDLDGKVIGKHEGLINYTVGQRRGIEQSTKLQGKDKEVLYAIGFNLKKNQLVVGKNQEVFSDSMILSDPTFTSEANRNKVILGNELKVKIRYRHPEVSVKSVHLHKNGTLLINFEELQRAITPGQSAVFYSGDEVLGGGVIR
jgi:tRNA-specific 2-thiouridylase